MIISKDVLNVSLFLRTTSSFLIVFSFQESYWWRSFSFHTLYNHRLLGLIVQTLKIVISHKLPAVPQKNQNSMGFRFWHSSGQMNSPPFKMRHSGKYNTPNIHCQCSLPVVSRLALSFMNHGSAQCIYMGPWLNQCVQHDGLILKFFFNPPWLDGIFKWLAKPLWFCPEVLRTARNMLFSFFM